MIIPPRVKIAVYVAVGVSVIVIAVVVFIYKKCRNNASPEEITLANFDVEPNQPILDQVRSLDEEEQEFDDLVASYHQARAAETCLADGELI